MIPSLGNFALWICLCFAVLQFVVSYKKNVPSLLRFNKIAVNGLLLCTLISFVCLISNVSNIWNIGSIWNVCPLDCVVEPAEGASSAWLNKKHTFLLFFCPRTITKITRKAIFKFRTGPNINVEKLVDFFEFDLKWKR